ncbi:MAG: Sec-independent protein translocase protein TatB [Azoarcus sp.]|jgi:sec-independent protein translocase protein TatB|nr:Sec-independent protein translocase protein TatB [Azoarcus sp.]
MFDIGFSELVVIAIVLLVVVGPERLPKVARTAGHLFGRMQRYVSDVKAEIRREIQLEDLKKIQQQTQEMDQAFRKEMDEIQSGMREALRPDEPPPATPPQAPPPAAAIEPSKPQPEAALDAPVVAAPEKTADSV